MRFIAAAALVFLLAGCEGRIHWNEARIEPATIAFTDALQDPNITSLQYIRNHGVGLRLTVPFDFGWDGYRWQRDPGYPTGVYADPVLIDGKQR